MIDIIISDEKLKSTIKWAKKQERKKRDKLTSASYWNNNPELLKRIRNIQKNNSREDYTPFMVRIAKHKGAKNINERDFKFYFNEKSYYWAQYSRKNLILARKVKSLKNKTETELENIIKNKNDKTINDASNILLYRILNQKIGETITISYWDGDLEKEKEARKEMNNTFTEKQKNIIKSMSRELNWYLNGDLSFKDHRVDPRAYSLPQKGFKPKGERIIMYAKSNSDEKEYYEDIKKYNRSENKFDWNKEFDNYVDDVVSYELSNEENKKEMTHHTDNLEKENYFSTRDEAEITSKEDDETYEEILEIFEEFDKRYSYQDRLFKGKTWFYYGLIHVGTNQKNAEAYLKKEEANNHYDNLSLDQDKLKSVSYLKD